MFKRYNVYNVRHLSLACKQVITIHPVGGHGFMAALDEKSGDHQNQKDSSSGDHECLYKPSWQSIQQLLR